MPEQMTPLQLVAYYANLLIIQYLGKPKAYSTVSTFVAPVIMPQTTVQQLNFSGVAASGSFVLQIDSSNSITISWNESAASIQTAIRTISAYSEVSVSGSIASQSLTFTFTSVVPPFALMTIGTNSLETAGSLGIEINITEIDQTLAIAVQNGFNLIGSSIAQGAQLDIIGKYVGVSRNYPNLILDDADFLTVIQFAIVQNNSGSSLATIEANLNTVFPGEFLVKDYADMTMSYIFGSSLVNNNVLTAILDSGLIPAPMGVGVTVIVPPTITSLFGFRTYDAPNPLVKPFNTYDSFNTSWYFLSYSNAYVVG